MRTMRCSGRRGGVSQHALGRGVSAWGVSAPVHAGIHTPPPSVDRILDTRLWKHYLSATTVADGKEKVEKKEDSFFWRFT